MTNDGRRKQNYFRPSSSVFRPPEMSDWLDSVQHNLARERLFATATVVSGAPGLPPSDGSNNVRASGVLGNSRVFFLAVSFRSKSSIAREVECRLRMGQGKMSDTVA